MCWLGIPGGECPEAAAGAGDGVRVGGGGGRLGEGVRLTEAVVEKMFRLTDDMGSCRCPAGRRRQRAALRSAGGEATAAGVQTSQDK